MLRVRAHVLSIQDNENDTALLQRVWGADPEISLTCRKDGTRGLEHLQTDDQRMPNLILLAGRFEFTPMATIAVLARLKHDSQLRCIPVVVFSGSPDPAIINGFYDAYASCVIAIPDAFDDFTAMLATVKNFWLSIARLPRETTRAYEAR